MKKKINETLTGIDYLIVLEKDIGARLIKHKGYAVLEVNHNALDRVNIVNLTNKKVIKIKEK